MRFTLSALVLLAAITIPSVAHATALTISINGGPANTYIIPSTLSDYVVGVRSNYEFPDDSATPRLQLEFTNPTAYEGFGFGPMNFVLSFDSGVQYDFTGPQLYSGSEDNPVFLLGTYELGPQPAFGLTDTATLVISAEPPPPTVTPEPSSLVLLGTGIVGMFGVARRRFKV